MEDCPICLEPCETDVFSSECCNKHFHTLCHAECMKVNSSCPLCRSVLIHVEPEPVQLTVLVPVPVRYCSKLHCYVFLSLLLLCGFMGVIIVCLITKEYSYIKSHQNVTGFS